MPGQLNTLADEKSRIFDDKTEWKLNAQVFQQIVGKFVTPEIDLFASRLNYQFNPYVSWFDLILASWRSSTQKQYLTYIHKWVKFCNSANLDIFTTEVTHILEFLTGLFNDGLGYSTINTARSALSTFLGITVAECP